MNNNTKVFYYKVIVIFFRIRCIEHLINTTPFLNAESKLLKSAIAESVICTKDINSKCRQCAFNLINSVGNVLKPQEGGKWLSGECFYFYFRSLLFLSILISKGISDGIIIIINVVVEFLA